MHIINGRTTRLLSAVSVFAGCAQGFIHVNPPHCSCHTVGSMAAVDEVIATPGAQATSKVPVANPEEGYDLAGLLSVKDTESRDVWVLCHGLLSNKDGTVPLFVSQKANVNTFRFDFAGNGESGGEFRYAGYQREVGDLRAVVSHLRSAGWDVVTLLGHSKGAAAVLKYGEAYDDVPLIINVAGRFHTQETPRSRFTEEQWKMLEEEGSFQWTVKGGVYPVRKEDFAERAGLDMLKTSQSISKARVLTIHGQEDETIPVADAHEFAKHIGQHTLVVVEGATHRFATEPEQKAVMEALAEHALPRA